MESNPRVGAFIPERRGSVFNPRQDTFLFSEAIAAKKVMRFDGRYALRSIWDAEPLLFITPPLQRYYFTILCHYLEAGDGIGPTSFSASP